MNHPQPDELLLFASGELEEVRLGEIASHVATCSTCQGELTQIERSLVALERATPRRSARNRPLIWAGVALGAAAVLALVFIRQPEQSSSRPGWSAARMWSTHAGYFAGGPDVIEIDSQLTRLEQGWSYGRP